jgi:AcrR family transcriptional regulator
MKSGLSTSRRQERSEATRARLIRAAEKIFARDGFEAARLEEIAAEAGYTRGAFYANFKTKEDIFFALLEGEISSRIDTVERLMKNVSNPADKPMVFREFLFTIAQDRRWSLLSLEFKLFALRHPDVKARLAAMNRRLIRPRVGILQDIAQASGRKLPAPPSAIAVSLSAAINALALEHMVDRGILPEAALKNILASYLDSLIGSPSSSKPTNRRQKKSQASDDSPPVAGRRPSR